MEIDNIKTLMDLYEYVKADKIQWRSTSKQTILQYEIKILKRKKYTGKFALIKKIIVAIYPLCYILACYKYKKIISFRSEDVRLNISKSAKEDILNNIDKYNQVCELLDEESRQIYIDMLIYRLTGDYTYSIKNQSSGEQYFSEKIRWGKQETVVDCGAYIGDTLLAFLKHKIDIENYYMYELDDDNYTKMQEICRMAEDKKIKVHPRKQGVYSCSATLFFQADADSSRIVDYPTETSIPVVAIDEDISDKVTFIKMDIEGSELDAINGASKTIKRDKPTLAICIYHKQEDFWKIPLRIKEICPEYKRFWIEQYSPWDLETVLFAEV